MAYKISAKNTGCVAIKFVEWKLRKYEIVLFSKSYSPEGQFCDRLIQSCNGVTEHNYEYVQYEKRGDCSLVDDYLWSLSGKEQRQGPHIFIRGDYLGGHRKLALAYKSGKLQKIISNLPNFPPGATNYRDNDTSWNLALQADPDYRPDTVLRVMAEEAPQTFVKILDWNTVGRANVDCSHFAGKRASISRSSANKTSTQGGGKDGSAPIGITALLTSSSQCLQHGASASTLAHTRSPLVVSAERDRSLGGLVAGPGSRSTMYFNQTEAMGPVIDSMRLNLGTKVALSAAPTGQQPAATPHVGQPSGQGLSTTGKVKSQSSMHGSDHWSRADHDTASQSHSQAGSKLGHETGSEVEKADD